MSIFNNVFDAFLTGGTCQINRAKNAEELPDSSDVMRVLHRTVDFLEDDRRLYTRVRPNISRAASSRTHVGMYRAARKLQSPAVPATGGEDDLVDGEPVISETEKRRSGRLIREHLIYSFIPLLERAWLPHGGPPLCGPVDEAFREILSLSAIAFVSILKTPMDSNKSMFIYVYTRQMTKCHSTLTKPC